MYWERDWERDWEKKDTAVVDKVELDVAPAPHVLPLLLLLRVLLVLVLLLRHCAHTARGAHTRRQMRQIRQETDETQMRHVLGKALVSTIQLVAADLLPRPFLPFRQRECERIVSELE